MMQSPGSSLSQRALIPTADEEEPVMNDLFLRDPTTISTKDIQFPKIMENDGQVEEQTLMQVEVVNDELSRKKSRSELASKGSCLTRRWQTALVTTLILLVLGVAIGGLAYWITLPKVITKPFLLYGESCYMNSRSCDATRMLWCPAGTCLCRGDFDWDSAAQNCSCAPLTTWTGFKCQGYGQYGDPCNTVPCRPTLTCIPVINQTFSTGQAICACDNITFLDTSASPSVCIPRLGIGATCQTKFDCQGWLGLSCAGPSGSTTCSCGAKTYWNGSLCVSNALGWQPCSVSIPCDTSRGLTCSISNLCECDQLSYWDNVTTLTCQQKKTYAVPCQFDFQCNTTVNLTCPMNSTGCNCYAISTAYMCDCQMGTFWDGQRCVAQHIFNGTCPGQYACLTSGGFVCYLGHCICPGNMVWNNPVVNQCACPTNTIWNNTQKTCN